MAASSPTLAERMAEFGVGMAFHHHMGTIVETDEEVDLLMRHTGPAVGLLYDTGHSRLRRRRPGGAGAPACRPDRPRPLQGHPPRRAGARPRRSIASFMQAVVDGIFTVPGDGCIDYATILKVLADHGYAGWLVVEAEQDPAKAHPLTYAKLGFCKLARLALQAGFTIAP